MIPVQFASIWSFLLFYKLTNTLRIVSEMLINKYVSVLLPLCYSVLICASLIAHCKLLRQEDINCVGVLKPDPVYLLLVPVSYWHHLPYVGVFASPAGHGSGNGTCSFWSRHFLGLLKGGSYGASGWFSCIPNLEAEGKKSFNVRPPYLSLDLSNE